MKHRALLNSNHMRHIVSKKLYDKDNAWLHKKPDISFEIKQDFFWMNETRLKKYYNKNQIPKESLYYTKYTEDNEAYYFKERYIGHYIEFENLEDIEKIVIELEKLYGDNAYFSVSSFSYNTDDFKYQFYIDDYQYD